MSRPLTLRRAAARAACALPCLVALSASSAVPSAQASLAPWKARFDHPAATARAAAAAARAGDLPIPGRVLVIFRASASRTEQRLAVSASGGRVRHRIPQLHTVELSVDKRRSASIAARLRGLPGVRSVEPAVRLRAEHAACAGNPACFVPNDPLFAYQWYLQNDASTTQTLSTAPVFGSDIDAPQAWATAQGASSVIVGVVDTGIDLNHPDLTGKIADSATPLSNSDAYDNFGHGTFVAGIIAADTNNGAGIAGVAPNVRLFNLKASDDYLPDGSYDPTVVADGVVYGVDHGVNILNLSLGGYGFSQVLHDALAYAYAHDVLVVASAGNDGSTTPTFPAADVNAISVGATDNADHPAYFSNFDARWVDIAAPGEGIVSTVPTYANSMGTHVDYDISDGTSFSAPQVAGAAAVLWSITPDANNNGKRADDVAARLESYADNSCGTGVYWKYGRLNLCRAVNQSSACPVPAPPTTTSAPAGTGGVVNDQNPLPPIPLSAALSVVRASIRKGARRAPTNVSRSCRKTQSGAADAIFQCTVSWQDSKYYWHGQLRLLMGVIEGGYSTKYDFTGKRAANACVRRDGLRHCWRSTSF